MARPVNTYRLAVDYYKWPKHSTAGGYDVGAKSPEDAVSQLQKAIGFGSVQVLYGFTAGDEYAQSLKGKAARHCGTRKVRMYHADEGLLPEGSIKRVGDARVHHDCDPVNMEPEPVEAPPKRSFRYGHDRYGAMA